MITPRASTLSYNLDANPNKNEQGSHSSLLSYDDNAWKYELDETNTIIFKKSLNVRASFRSSTLLQKY